MRIVFTDLDETLLNTQKDVPAENREAAAHLAELNIPFVPCTGRPLKGLTCVVASLPGVSHIVSSDGAVVYEVNLPAEARAELAGAAEHDVRSFAGDILARYSRVLHACPIGVERTVELYERVRQMDVTFDVFGDGSAWSERARWEKIGCIGMPPDLEHLVRSMRIPCDELVPEIAARQNVVERVTVMWWHPGDRERVLGAVHELGLSAVSSGEHNLEITDQEATKGNALTWLCGHLGIDVVDAVAFGDSSNDASMIKAAGTGVAMCNGSSEVKALADCVTEYGCDDGGEGRWLLERLRSGKVGPCPEGV